MTDDFNMSRKFLKQVGTSQKAIEDALRDASNGEYVVEAKINIKDIGMKHSIWHNQEWSLRSGSYQEKGSGTKDHSGPQGSG